MTCLLEFFNITPSRFKGTIFDLCVIDRMPYCVFKLIIMSLVVLQIRYKRYFNSAIILPFEMRLSKNKWISIPP